MLDPQEVEYELVCEPEHMRIRGNCSAINDEVDEECATWIENQLEAGNDWAWCSVRVTARWEGFEEHTYLGGCSYTSEEDFRKDGYFEDMKHEALQALVDQVVI